MHCIDCDYALQHLNTDRCPECGRLFDPSDQTTFRPVPLDQRRAYIKSEIKTTCFILVLLATAVVPLLAIPYYFGSGLGCFMIVVSGLVMIPVITCVYRIRQARRGYKDEDA